MDHLIRIGIKAEEEGELNYFISKIITKYRFEQNK